MPMVFWLLYEVLQLLTKFTSLQSFFLFVGLSNISRGDNNDVLSLSPILVN